MEMGRKAKGKEGSTMAREGSATIVRRGESGHVDVGWVGLGLGFIWVREFI
jgi:hypothetical protein